MKAALVGMFLRHMLTGIGALVVERGYATSDEWTAAGGGVMAVVGMVLSYLNKKRLLS